MSEVERWLDLAEDGHVAVGVLDAAVLPTKP